MHSGIPTKSQVIGVLVNLVSSGKLNSLEVIKFEHTGCLSAHAETVVSVYFPDWLPTPKPAVPSYKTPVLQADGLEMVDVATGEPKRETAKTPVIKRADAPWKF